MGVLYSVFPVNKPVREWLAEEGLATPLYDGCAPTLNQIQKALETIDDHAVTYTISESVWQARVEDLLVPETGPWTVVNVADYTSSDETCSFYFSRGWPELIVKIVHRIAQQCGSYVIVPDTDCSVVVVEANSDIDSIIRMWSHIRS